jgi:hypothetical protein
VSEIRKQENRSKKPLKRSILIGSIIFIAVLCLLLGLTTYKGYERSLYDRYEAYITDMLTYVSSSIDTEKPRKYSQVENLIPLKLNFKLVPHASDRHDVFSIRTKVLS